jgi:integrase
MVRPRTPIRSFGAISVQRVAAEKWRARTRYRFDDGKLRQLERFGSTKAKARLSLQKALTEVATASPSNQELQRETTLARLADKFLDSKKDRAPRTIDTYRQTIEHQVKPKIGQLTVTEATTARLDRFIGEVAADNGPGAAKACRAVLSGMLGLAVRSDLLKSNPVRDVEHITRHRRGATAIPLNVLPKLLKDVSADKRLKELDQVDVIYFLACTGCRIGEALATRWSSLDFEAGTLRIDSNLVRARGRGVVLQDHPKTAAGARTISIPLSLIERLHRRHREFKISNEQDLVFPTIRGNARDPRNTSRDWREARERLGYPDVTSHSFRKTVATALDQAGMTAREIAEYLGHENPSITQDVYMAKNTGGKRAAAALDSVIAP